MEQEVTYLQPDESSPYPILLLPFHQRLVLPRTLFPSGLPNNMSYVFPISTMCAICLCHLILLDVMTVRIFEEE
jgi:hypothetical protein